MSDQNSFFSSVGADVVGAEERFLGPTYPYYKNVKDPRGLGMNDRGTLPQLGKNVSGLIAYTEVLVSGTGNASTTGRPLGNKFFLKTGANCEAPDGKKVPRYIYINNIPMGNIPLVSSLVGNMKTFRGLVPGTMSNLNALNPMGFVAAFSTKAVPKCRSLSMEVVDNNNARRRETRYVADVDIAQLDPCNWGGRGRNPVSGRRCTSGFTGAKPQPPNYSSTSDNSKVTFDIHPEVDKENSDSKSIEIDEELSKTLDDDNDDSKMPKDILKQIYFALLGIMMIYLLYLIVYVRK